MKAIDKQSFETFVRKEYKGLVRFARSITRRQEDAEDAVQNALMYIWQKLNGDAWEGPRPVSPSYLRRCVQDRAKNILKAQAIRALTRAEEDDVRHILYPDALNDGTCGWRIMPAPGAE